MIWRANYGGTLSRYSHTASPRADAADGRGHRKPETRAREAVRRRRDSPARKRGDGPFRHRETVIFEMLS